jgi:hypothetical protein
MLKKCLTGPTLLEMFGYELAISCCILLEDRSLSESGRPIRPRRFAENEAVAIIFVSPELGSESGDPKKRVDRATWGQQQHVLPGSFQFSGQF